jgi:hypothetical protein
MIEEDFVFASPLEGLDSRHRSRLRGHKPRSSWGRLRAETLEGFRCGHCRAYVTVVPEISGVVNRNHCPYCLWSRHVDLYEAGDRMAACKENMQPLGLTIKKTRNKYSPTGGELMLIHRCTECGKLSINRIAADDDAERIWEMYEKSLKGDWVNGDWSIGEKSYGDRLIVEPGRPSGIQPLGPADRDLVSTRLFGGQVEP